MDVWQLMEIPRARLGLGSPVRVRVGGDPASLMRDMAGTMAGIIRENNRQGKPTCLIVPVGPVGQYEPLARIIREEPLDCRNVTFLNMDEFLDDADHPISGDHPLSFRGFMQRGFYDHLPPETGFRRENRLFPDPERPEAVAAAIAERGGVDACFGGIGLNGHIAFNEPEQVDPETFATRPTRVLTLDPVSRAHMAVNLSCAIDLIPTRAVTVGMREILGARRILLYANRPWQRGVVRQVAHGPVSASCPASLIQRHPAAELIVADFVADAPEVRLQ